MVTSTAPGTFALTGVVTDQIGAPLPGAIVTLTSAALPIPVVVPTGLTGAFAVINMPATSTYTIRVDRLGYGSLTMRNVSFLADEEYGQNLDLSTDAQDVDATPPAEGSLATPFAAQSASASAVAARSGRWTSLRHVPPTIHVRVIQNTATTPCGSTLPTFTQAYSWRSYVLHVMQGEIGGSSFTGGRFQIAASRATASGIQNFAWWILVHRDPSTIPNLGSADIRSNEQDQCFSIKTAVPASFQRWLGDVLPTRVLEGTDLNQGFYRAGNYSCTDRFVVNGKNGLSQLGAKAREERCNDHDWRHITEYFYGSEGNVDSTNVAKPPVPTTSFQRVTGGIKFSFPSRVKFGGKTSDVGWEYSLQRYFPAGLVSKAGWYTVYKQGFSVTRRTVPITTTYTPTGRFNTSARYRALACNPVGCSPFASFNGGNPISPG